MAMNHGRRLVLRGINLQRGVSSYPTILCPAACRSSHHKLPLPANLVDQFVSATPVHKRLLSSTVHPRFDQRISASTMAPSVLGLGIPASSPSVPDHLREGLKKILDAMEADMDASSYAWEMFYVEKDMEFGPLIEKLREKEWDCVMVGVGLRTGPNLTPFFEKIVNAVHKELPKTKIAFNVSIGETQEACRRALEL